MQRLILIRHAAAHERDPHRWPDDTERPLTAKGKRKFQNVASRLHVLIDRVDLLFSSDLKRATQTARILTKHAGFPRMRELSELRPDTPIPRVISALSEHGEEQIAIVGHEPQFSALVSQLLTGAPRTIDIDFKKGGVVVLAFKKRIRAKQAELEAYVPPRAFGR